MSVESFIGLAPEANDIMPISRCNVQVRSCNLHAATFTLQIAKLQITDYRWLITNDAK